MIRAESLSKSFGSLRLFSNLSLSVEAGEAVAICGRSGSGKTTLLHLLGTLDLPDAGRIMIAGKEATQNNAAFLRRTQIGFIFQAFNLLEDFSVLENVLMPARIARKRTEEKRALDLLEEVGLLEFRSTKAKFLSGGERQRVAIARALCNDPSILLADEPSGNLDSANAERIGTLLLDCVRKKKKSLILVTHDQDLAALCDKRYLLKNGTLEIQS